ncbi:hypothetical protein AVEN_75965-1 [Araneus ventricosus]|uniref:Uncharacterized protein n=1 Tax=Araneus ventricosus TaxID=182803 RepID=A0A4Y2RQM6_ARAVE|nr:hypothetical protein AVEN_75965-1 [Araneus ventricosus]
MPPGETHRENGDYCYFYSFNDTNRLVCIGPYSYPLNVTPTISDLVARGRTWGFIAVRNPTSRIDPTTRKQSTTVRRNHTEVSVRRLAGL